MNNDEITTNTVIQKASLLSMIENYSQLHNTVCLTDNDINKITEKLILSHTPTDHDVMKK